MKISYSSSFDYFISPIKKYGVNVYIRSIRYRDLKTKNSILFIDDDLLDIRALQSLPFLYSMRLWLRTTSKRSKIFKDCEIWVSTPYLAKKYNDYKPRLLKPIASGDLLERNWNGHQNHFDKKNVRICYHGTWSHRIDMEWLVPVIAEVQSRCSNTVFEVIGGKKASRLFKGIPRVDVLDVMTWSEYLFHTQNKHQDIGLAPLIDNLFNRARGPIKFFDYARCGAVGIYSRSNAYNDFVAHGIDGFLLDNNHTLWVETIVSLVNSANKCQGMARAAWQKVLQNSPQSPEIQEYLKSF